MRLFKTFISAEVINVHYLPLPFCYINGHAIDTNSQLSF